jgi:hypothetical protein
MTKIILLTRGLTATVSDEDFDLLNKFNWNAVKGAVYYYAVRSNDKAKMHRIIVDAPSGMQVDHIDGNTLNNTRENLRICTVSQNQCNSKVRVDNTTGYKGVTICKSKYYAQIRHNGKRISLGYYEKPEDAARAYDEAAKKYHKEFASLNYKEDARH